MNSNLMKWTIFILFVWGINGHRPSKIIGPAKQVFPRQRSYQVSLWQMTEEFDNIFYYCSGSILDERHILTAAHCVYDSDLSRLIIGAGSVDVKDPDLIFRTVTQIFIHPEYKRLKTDKKLLLINDIAILAINSPFLLGTKIRAIKLPSTNVKDYDFGEIAGWGNSTIIGGDSVDLSRFLLKTIMQVLPRHTCLDPIPETQFCAIDPAEIRTVSGGDSGSPFVMNSVVVGIASHAYGSPKIPSYYTNVFSYLEFIKCVRNFGKECNLFKSKGNSILSACPLQIPHTVSIVLKQGGTQRLKQLCNGAILDKSHIITAAHCVVGWKNLRVKVSTFCVAIKYSSPTIRSVIEVYIHPRYSHIKGRDDENIRNDIAILIVDPPLPLDSSLTAINLPTATVQMNQIGEIGGIRMENLIEKKSSVFKTIMTVKWPEDFDSKFCVVDNGQEMIGDHVVIGSPFISNNTIFGIVSYIVYSPDIHAFCTNIFSNLDFIETILNI